MKWGQTPFPGNGAGPPVRSGPTREWFADIARQWQQAVRSPDCRTVKSLRPRPPGSNGNAGSA
jgi:hypothetical protein